jgi:hypothetical protein
VDTGSVWILSSTDNTLTLQENDDLIQANPAYSAGCSVTNAVKEVLYTITYTTDKTGLGNTIKKVSADFIL